MNGLHRTIQDLYKKSPYWVKNITGRVARVIPTGMLYGKNYRDARDLISRSEFWSAEQHREWQISMLRTLLLYCRDNVPYYEKVFKERGFDPATFKEPEQLESLPFLTKDIIRNNSSALTSRAYKPHQLIKVTTGGSTGEPLEFYFDKAYTRQVEKAFIHDHWGRVGYKPRDRVCALRGALIERNEISAYDPVQNMLVLSPFNLTPDRISDYVERLNRFKPRFLWVYPSTATQFARELNRQNKRLDFPLDAVICASEKVYPAQRELLHKVFGCRVFSYYGLTEYCVCGAECEYSSDIHIYPQYGFTEFIKPENHDVAEHVYEIVATGFNNFAFPFIRYRTGDLALTKDSKKSCKCGRNYQIVEDIIGRGADFIITRSKKVVSLTSLIFAQHFHAFGNIRKMQFVQDKIGEVTVRIVKTGDYTVEDEKEIEKVLSRCVGEGELTLYFDYVEDIPSTRMGKHLFLKQNLDLSEIGGLT